MENNTNWFLVVVLTAMIIYMLINTEHMTDSAKCGIKSSDVTYNTSTHGCCIGDNYIPSQKALGAKNHKVVTVDNNGAIDVKLESTDGVVYDKNAGDWTCETDTYDASDGETYKKQVLCQYTDEHKNVHANCTDLMEDNNFFLQK